MSSSFEKLSKALEESVSGLIDSRIENVKSLITNIDSKQKTLLASKTNELQEIKGHVEKLESNVQALTSHEVETIENLQNEVTTLTSRISEIENETNSVKQKLEKLSILLERQTEFRRSLRM